jgi:pimeloyl-ACP methyl ester carboxylesterase
MLPRDDILPAMSRGTGRYLKSDRGSRIAKRLLLAGAAVGVPLVAGALLRRRAEAPSAPRWGRTHRYAGRSGREVVFQELGSGPPVVLLHSFGPGYGGDQWRAVAETLAERHCVYVPDLPGWGRTRTAGNAHRPDVYLSLLEDFLAGVVRDRAVIVAAGLAAAYAVRITVDHPNRVRALALVSPEGLGEDGEGRFRTAAGAVVGRLLSLPLLDDLVLDVLTGRAAVDHHLRRGRRAPGAPLPHQPRPPGPRRPLGLPPRRPLAERGRGTGGGEGPRLARLGARLQAAPRRAGRPLAPPPPRRRLGCLRGRRGAAARGDASVVQPGTGAVPGAGGMIHVK